MKYHKIDSKLFIKNRKNFMSRMNKKSIAFFNSNDIYPVSADSTLPFEQHRDIFYLSGVDQEESVLMLCPSASDPKHREVLFLKETDDHIAVWEGPKLNKKQAYETSGVKTVYWLNEMEKVIDELANECDTIYYNHNEHYRARIEMEMTERGLEASFRASQAVTRDLLLESMPRLKSWFEEGGIDVAYTGLTQDSGAHNGGNSTGEQNTQPEIQVTESEESSDLTDNQLVIDDSTGLDVRV